MLTLSLLNHCLWFSNCKLTNNHLHFEFVSQSSSLQLLASSTLSATLRIHIHYTEVVEVEVDGGDTVAEETDGGGGIAAEVENLKVESEDEDEKEVEEVEEAGEGGRKEKGTTKLGEEIEGRTEINGEQEEPMMQENGGNNVWWGVIFVNL
ncbi:hypothetical protein VNO78_33364 [Psophocarpus tetragonolobus]|uniref:Uncharacterized protein n=1 Tax=Psophocarpus tetragonolobus TaxID=3891 RepID=A0AAN9NY66_PSOTE